MLMKLIDFGYCLLFELYIVLCCIFTRQVAADDLSVFGHCNSPRNSCSCHHESFMIDSQWLCDHA